MSDYADDLREMPLDELSDSRLELSTRLSAVQRDLAAIQDEINRRFEGAAKLALDEAGKEHGTATRTMEGGYKIKADIKQTVKWNSDVLQVIASDMDWEQIQHWFKISFSVPEAKFKAMPPGDLQKAVATARTTKLAPLKVTLIDPEAD